MGSSFSRLFPTLLAERPRSGGGGCFCSCLFLSGLFPACLLLASSMWEAAVSRMIWPLSWSDGLYMGHGTVWLFFASTVLAFSFSLLALFFVLLVVSDVCTVSVWA